MSLFSNFIKLLFVGSLLSAISPVYGNEPANECSTAFKGLTEEMEASPFFKEVLSQIDGLEFEINISEIDEDTKEKISEYVTILNEMSKESSSCSADIKKEAQSILEKLLKWQIVIEEAASEQEPQSNYLGLKIAAGVLTAFVVPGLFFLPKYMANDQPGNRIARMYFRIFQLLRIATVAPQVIFGGGGVQYVNQDVYVIDDYSEAERKAAFNKAAQMLGYEEAYNKYGTGMLWKFGDAALQKIEAWGNLILVGLDPRVERPIGLEEPEAYL